MPSEINSLPPEQTLTLEEGFGALDTTTTLPYSGQYDLGSSLSRMTTAPGNLAYGTLFRVESGADTLFQLNFWGSDDVGIDTTIYIYHQDGFSNIVPVQTFDADSRGRGEAVKYISIPRRAPITSVSWAQIWKRWSVPLRHHRIPSGSQQQVGTLVLLWIRLPVPEAGDLWSWNEGTLTPDSDGRFLHAERCGPHPPPSSCPQDPP